jgi:hypothetical protein
MNTKQLRQTTDLLEWQESSVATGHSKQKFPYHTKKIFTFKLLVGWLLRHPVVFPDYAWGSQSASFVHGFLLKVSTDLSPPPWMLHAQLNTVIMNQPLSQIFKVSQNIKF